MPGCTRSLSIIMPMINVVSSVLPPIFFSNFMLSMSISFTPFSATILTAFTARSVNSSRAVPAPFPVIDVTAIFRRVSESFGEILPDIPFKISYAFSAANLYPAAINVGCTSCSRRSSARLSNSPAMITAVVVPSPTSSS